MIVVNLEGNPMIDLNKLNLMTRQKLVSEGDLADYTLETITSG